MILSPSPDVVLVSGSLRLGSLTTAVMRLVAAELGAAGVITAEIIPTGIPVSCFGDGLPQEVAANYAAMLRQARGVVLCTPEYNGSYSATIKAFIEGIGFPSPLEGKVVSLVGVASGVIGAIKALEHLRSVCSHCGAHALPFALSIAKANQVIAASGQCLDSKVAAQIKESASKLIEQI